MNEVSSAAGLNDFKQVVDGIDFSILTDYTGYVIGAVAGVVIGLIALKKGWSFVKRQIKGA